MDIRQLQLFLAVMDCSSVTKAAEVNCLSPGAVSLQIRGLAAELRTELFSRSGKHLVPTPSAHRLAERARVIVRQMAALKQEFENDPVTDTRPFAFATGPTTLIHRLGRPLRMLRKKYVHTQIQVTVAPTEDIVAGLLDRRFDLGLISLPVAEENLQIFPLFDEELLLLRPSATRVRGNHIGTVKPADLSNAPFLLYPKKSNMRTIIDGYFQDIGMQPRVIMEADDTEALKQLVESGFGSSILPEYALRGQPKFYQTFRISGHRLSRKQALAVARTEYPRALTESIASFLQSALAPPAK